MLAAENERNPTLPAGNDYEIKEYKWNVHLQTKKTVLWVGCSASGNVYAFHCS
jgi:hypothetical protein